MLAAAGARVATPASRRSSRTFHQLDAIPEGIGDVDTNPPFERVFDDVDAGLTKTLHQGTQVAHEERRMCLPGRTEVGLDAEVDLDRAAFEPRATPTRKLRRLCHFRDSQEARIELARLGLSAWWHRELHVIESYDGHRRRAAAGDWSMGTLPPGSK
jgi:hypothetical protein